MTDISKVIRVLILSALLASPLTVWAQDVPAMVAIRMVDTVPGKAAQFEAALKRFGEAFKKVRPDAGYSIRTITAGGPGNAYVMFAAMENASELQPRNILAEAFGEEEASRIGAQFDGAIQHTRLEAFVPRPDLALMPEQGPAEAVMIIRVDVAIGGNQAFEAYMRQLVEATAKVAPQQTWYAYAPAFGAGNTTST